MNDIRLAYAGSAKKQNAPAMKGAPIVSTLNWVRAEFGEKVLRDVLAAMPPESARLYENAMPFSWVPVTAQDAFIRALTAKVSPKDRRRTIELMRRLGGYVAEDNLSTLYKVILAFTSPGSLLSRMPRLWSTYFNGLELADVESRGNSASYVVRHIGYYMLGAHAEGWIEFAYRKVGSRNPKVVCAELERGVDHAKDLRFEMSW